MKLTALFAVLAAIVLMVQPCIAVDYPAPVGYVNDFAGILSKEEAQSLESQLSSFEKRTSVELAVVTVKSLQGMSVESYTAGLGNTWGVGKKGLNNGIILLVAPNERKVRIEVASGANKYFTQSEINSIIQNNILPYFKSGNMNVGTISGATKIISHVDQKITAPSQPVETKEQREMNWNLLWQLIIGSLLVVFTIWGIIAWINFRGKKKELADLITELGKKIDVLPIKTATQNLARLKEIASENCLKKLKGIDSDFLSGIVTDLEQVKLCGNGWAEIDEALVKASNLQTKIMKAEWASSYISEKLKEIVAAKNECERISSSLETLFKEKKKLLENDEILPETRKIFQANMENFLLIKSSINGKVRDDWVNNKSVLAEIESDLNNLESRISEDQAFRERAKKDGPELAKNLAEMISQLDEKIGRSSGRRKMELVNARSNLSSANDIAGIDWTTFLLYYLAAETILSATSHSSSSYSSISESSSYHHDDSSSFDSFGGFGGGGDFGGGGGSGSW